MLNSNTDNTVLGPPDLNVVPAGNHMGKMLGVVARFAQLKVLFVHELVQLFERKTVVLAGENPSTELMIFLLFTSKVETE